MLILDVSRDEPFADANRGLSPSDSIDAQVVLKLRDPLGIARGLAESVPDLVDELRRFSTDPASREMSSVLEELVRTAHLIEDNVTRALVFVERQALPANERWRPYANG